MYLKINSAVMLNRKQKSNINLFNIYSAGDVGVICAFLRFDVYWRVKGIFIDEG